MKQGLGVLFPWKLLPSQMRCHILWEYQSIHSTRETHSPTLKMQVIWQHISEDSNSLSHCHTTLKSHIPSPPLFDLRDLKLWWFHQRNFLLPCSWMGINEIHNKIVRQVLKQSSQYTLMMELKKNNKNNVTHYIRIICDK